MAGYYGNMTIQDYIDQHGLKLWRKWPTQAGLNKAWTPVFLVSHEGNGKTEIFSDGDKFEIYANPEHTHFVSVNTTRGLFRVVHYDFIPIISEWQPSRANYTRTAF